MGSVQKSDRHDYYDICRKFLVASGQWPYQKSRDKLIRMSVLVTWNVSVLFVQIAQFFVCETVECILQTIPMYMVALIVLVKLLTCHFNRRKIKYLIEQLDADWNFLDTQEEWEIMERYAMNGRWYALTYASYIYVCTFTFGPIVLLPRILDVVSPLNESRPIVLPCPAYYFVDEVEYFYYIFLHLEGAAIICITGLVAHDCTFLTYVEHICGLLAVVGFRFEHYLYKRNITNKYLIDSSDDVYVKNIAFTIQAHRKALHFAALVENAFSSSFAIQLLIIVIAMSSSLIQISAELHNDLTEVVRYLVFVVGQLLHLLVFSFQGQKLINHSIEIRAKIYNGLWYEIPVRSQRLLLFAMRKSIETISVSAGKIYIFSLESFTSIMQSSVSYFTVLSSFSEP